MKRFFLFSTVFFFLGISSVSAITVKQPNNTGLVAWIPFNDGTSTIAHDIGPYQTNPTLSNFSAPATAASGWAPGKRGLALSFDGVDDRVTFSGCKISSQLAGASVISSSRWLWVDSVPGGGSGYIVDFLTTGNAGSAHTVIVNDTMTVAVQSRSSVADSLQSFNSNGTIRTGVWNHVVLVVDYPSDTVKIYINGALDKTVGATFGNTTFTPDTCTSTDLIGSSATPDRFFDGKIDDYRVYNRTLTDTEISAMYRTGQVTRQTVSNNGLVGWWRFDEATSTVVHDFSGNSAHATMQSAPVWTRGERGGALDFDGIDDYLTTPLIRNAYPSMTAAAWVKYEGSITDGYSAVFAGQSADFFVGKNAGNSNVGVQDGAFSGAVAVGTNVWDGNWHHLVYRVTGGTGTIYVDGVAAGSAAFGGGSGAIWIAQENEGTGYDFTGKIDDARIYNRALSATEIYDLYRQNQTEVGGSQETNVSNGLVGYWSLNGKDLSWQENRAFDRSGNNNFGTLINLGTTTAPIIGKVGQALRFNGSTSYIQVPYSAALAPTTAISYGAWFKTTNKTLGQKIVSKTETGGYALVLNESIAGCTGTSLCGFVGVDVAGVNTYYGAGYDRSNITDNKWHHVMTTYDGETVLLYLDGVQVASNTSPSGPVKYSNANTFCIGTEPGGTCGITQFFSGGIDEVRVYNRAITAEEVKRIYALGK